MRLAKMLTLKRFVPPCCTFWAGWFMVCKVHTKQSSAKQRADWDASRQAAMNINMEFFDAMGWPGPAACITFQKVNAPPTRKKMMQLLHMARKQNHQEANEAKAKQKATKALARKVMRARKKEIKALLQISKQRRKLQKQISKYGIWMMCPRWLPSADAWECNAVVPAGCGCKAVEPVSQ